MSTPKLTPQQDAQIVAALNNSDITKAELARTYGVSPRSIDRAIERHRALSEKNTPVATGGGGGIELRPGDCVQYTSDMSISDIEDTINALCEAGMEVAEVDDIDELIVDIWERGPGEYFGWDVRDDTGYSFHVMSYGSGEDLTHIFTRLLQASDVLGTQSTQEEESSKAQEDDPMPSYSFMMSDSSITIWADEEQETINKSHPEFQTITDVIYESRGSQEALDMAFKEISKKAQLQVLTCGKVEIDPINALVTYMGHPIPLELMDRIVKAAQSGEDDRLNDLVEFTKRMYDNPYQKVIGELYSFLEACDIDIDSEGYVIAYKVVREDYTDIFSGSFDNSPGALCEMPRAFVNNDSSQTCSAGLHVCSKAYIPFFGHHSGSRIVKVKVDPADFVSIPDEYWGYDENGMVKAKARVCKYEVLSDVTDSIRG